MWKTLVGNLAVTGRFAHILPAEAAQIHCGAEDLVFLRRPYVDAGQVIQRFLVAGLIDRATITTIPVLIGTGRRFFGHLPTDVTVTLAQPWVYDFGVAQATYLAARAA
ncbi:dihydrofolate reductase family protein [Vulcanococcus limneticus Candia 3F8]|uniref:hypothetical protein n=1 Tax=Vulcanococcus limneticus TaxID=2170428 RepID=UPI0020CC40D7|nr:hypothetical protein [Vulcanococcus limneticus]MCP9893352.1 dihydrofolate reductase family protein [Vulcanococcus limneticus Candia 3F8]